METYNTFSRGSEWRKWDLHIHSNASDGKSTPAEIIKEAKAKGLSVIALTDHHTAKNIDQIKIEAAKESISVISGIEFRTEYGQKSVHMIGLFPDEFEGTVLNSKALHDLVLSPLGLSETSIIQKGKRDNCSEEKAFKYGMFLVQTDFKKAADLIHKYGGIVSVHAGSKDNSFDTEMKHQGSAKKNVQELYESLGVLKEELLNNGYIDICEIKKENDSEDFYLKKFGKPSILASDAHETSEIGNSCIWIKADPTFEGLKQIIYEPERISFEKPEEKAGYQVIESISIEHNDFMFNDIENKSSKGQQIELNPNLNSIIGGRSTGKSILLGCIAKKLKSTQEVKYDNEDYTKYIDDIISKAKIIWKDGVEDDNRDIEYFPQSHMYRLAKNREEIDNLIGNIIKQDLHKNALINTYKSFCSENNTEISNKLNKISQIHNELIEKRTLLKEKGDKKGIETEIERLTTELTELKDKVQISQTELVEYNELKDLYDSLIKQLKEIEEETLKIELLKNKLFVNNDFEFELIGLSDSNKDLLKSSFNKLKAEFQLKWVAEINGIIFKNVEQKGLISNSIEQITKKEIFQKGIEAFKSNSQFKQIEDKLKIQKEKLIDISKIEKEVIELDSQKNIQLDSIKSANKNYLNKINSIKDSLSVTKDLLQINAIPKFNLKEYRELLNWSINQQSFQGQEIVKENSNVQSNDDFFEKNEKLLGKLINNSITLKGGYDNLKLLNELYAKNFFTISYEVIYDKDLFAKMSEGKKAFVVLKLLLDFSLKDCPILIDQPEDDLDNRAIYKELVSYLKRKKNERQIIVVTHNPNIVVGADAEQIIVANQHGIGTPNRPTCKFQYVSGSIEFTKKPLKQRDKNDTTPILEYQGIREHVCEILEGGTDAFKKREEKYHLK